MNLKEYIKFFKNGLAKQGSTLTLCLPQISSCAHTPLSNTIHLLWKLAEIGVVAKGVTQVWTLSQQVTSK